MVRIVVLLQAQRLAIERLLHLLLLGVQAGEFGVTLLPSALGCSVKKLLAQECQALRSEQPLSHEAAHGVDENRFLDAKYARVAGEIGCGHPATAHVLTAHPVLVALAAALHTPPAEPAVDPPAQHVEATGALALPLWVCLRPLRFRRGIALLGALLDGIEQLAADKRLVRGLRAPYPLVARALDRAPATFVMAPPDVVAGVLGIAQQRVKLRLAPSLRQVVLILAVALRRRVAIKIRVQSLADRAEAQVLFDVPSEDQ
ncbi:MAG TPA: hypothetical protein VGC63_03750 [Solirubrobacterales bacterium]